MEHGPVQGRAQGSQAFIEPGAVVEGDHELVAAEPSGDVGPAAPGGQPFADGREHRVTGGVAEAAVDGLEAVEVEKDYG